MSSTPIAAFNTNGFVPVIGLEVHAQIASQSKLFSGAPAETFGKSPNTCVSFLDAGFPGMLPVVNAYCIEQGIRTGLGLKGTINLRSVFERKHYFYPDLPLGYQISQFAHPLMENGQVEIMDADGKAKIIRVQRLHLEQDAGKSFHDRDPRFSYIDFNRAGTGLMEIVSHPDLSTPEEAVSYARCIRSVVRCLGTCDGNMEQGNLRIDANVSIHRPGEPLGTRVELKNINSFRFLHQAIVYEIQRQIQCKASGEPLVQETRGWDAKKGITVSLRHKEEAYDYRYVPDPDLPEVHVSQDLVNTLAASLPELPEEKYRRFVKEFGLSFYDAALLTEESEVAAFFEAAVTALKHPAPELRSSIAHWISGELFASLNRSGLTLALCTVTPVSLAELVEAVHGGELSSTLAKEVWGHMWETGESPMHIMDQKGLRQVSEGGQIQRWVEEALASESKNLAAYLAGQEKLFGYFVGCVMKTAQGKGNPQMIQQILRSHLENLKP